MGADQQAKTRQKGRDIRRKAAHRMSADRILIVCEGSKTEPRYFEEIRQELRLPTAHICVLGSIEGSDPLSVVHCAEKIFRCGDTHRSLEPRTFDQIWAVFDRDEHESYHKALAFIKEFNLRMKNDIHMKVPFEAITSIPCFELWLLLHYEDVHAPLSRTEVYKRLRNHIPHYEKGKHGLWKMTNSRIHLASPRAMKLALVNRRNDDHGPYTDLHNFVNRLQNLMAR